jgi:hypothetical protein
VTSPSSSPQQQQQQHEQPPPEVARQPLLQVEVEYADGVWDVIDVYAGDSLPALAAAFCAKHSLPADLQGVVETLLTEGIRAHAGGAGTN